MAGNTAGSWTGSWTEKIVESHFEGAAKGFLSRQGLHLLLICREAANNQTIYKLPVSVGGTILACVVILIRVRV